MPTPSPTIVVMLSTNTDMGWKRAAIVTRPSAIVIARNPTTTGSIAATSAPNATTRTTSVSGKIRHSLRSVSSVLIVRTS